MRLGSVSVCVKYCLWNPKKPLSCSRTVFSCKRRYWRRIHPPVGDTQWPLVVHQGIANVTKEKAEMLGGEREWEERSEWQRSWFVFIDQLQNKAYLSRLDNGCRQRYLCEFFGLVFFLLCFFPLWWVCFLLHVSASQSYRQDRTQREAKKEEAYP